MIILNEQNCTLETCRNSYSLKHLISSEIDSHIEHIDYLDKAPPCISEVTREASVQEKAKTFAKTKQVVL